MDKHPEWTAHESEDMRQRLQATVEKVEASMIGLAVAATITAESMRALREALTMDAQTRELLERAGDECPAAATSPVGSPYDRSPRVPAGEYPQSTDT